MQKKDRVGYYEIYGFDPATSDYSKWLGTATRAVADSMGARVGGFIGSHQATPDGWGCKAKQ